jgi:hypothetical protein
MNKFMFIVIQIIIILCFIVTINYTQAQIISASGPPLVSYGSPSTTVAGLPVCSASLLNAVFTVTNALTPTVLGVVVGGGAVVTLVHCNGTSWVAG